MKPFSNGVCIFFIAHTQSRLGDFIAYIALILLTNQRFHSSFDLSLVLLADFLPAIALGAYLGHLIDKSSRRQWAIMSDLLRCLAFIGLALSGSFYGMLICALIAGLGSAIYTPAIMSGLPNISKKLKVAQLFAWQSSISSAASIAGPLIAGLLLTVISAQSILLLNAISFVVSAMLISRLKLDGTKSEVSQADNYKFREALKLPRAFILIMASGSFIALFAGVIAIAEVYFALHVLNLGSAGLGFLIGAYGSGMLIGNLVSVPKQMHNTPYINYLFGMLLLAGGLGCMAILRQPILLLILYAVAGFGNGLIAVNSRTLVHNLVHSKNYGLAYGLKDAGESAGLVVALLSAGILESFLGPKKLFVLAAGGIMATFLVTTYVSKRYSMILQDSD